MPGQHEGFPAGTHRIAAPVHPRACQADLEGGKKKKKKNTLFSILKK